jgi:formate hydrogenlyase subunit 5
MNLAQTIETLQQRWRVEIASRAEAPARQAEIVCAPENMAEIGGWLHDALGYRYAGLIVEQGAAAWELRHVFYADGEAGWIHVLARRPLSEETFPSISARVPAADWHEREAEDLFELTFEGHPHLGDFVLHNDAWQEGVSPMRKEFDARLPLARREPDPNWRPPRIVRAPGAFAMPIGPIYSGVTESVHFLLETVGEDVIHAYSRLFYKYRAIEKLAEGRTVGDALLLAERFNATTAFAHALAFCQAVEALAHVEVPARARALRVLLAELERLRHHAGAIQEIAESTGLVVAASQAAILEEELLRLSGSFTGHRYLFGLAACGGLSRDLADDACNDCVRRAQDIVRRLNELDRRLSTSSSFLDRLEQVGMVTEEEARAYGLVGPIARAAGNAGDLRRVQPYGGYDALAFDVPVESEGDGYARLRVLFAEARQSVRLMEQAAALPDGPVQAACAISSGAALGWVEAPRGAAFHWLRLGEDGRVARYHVLAPSFANWRSLHLAAENFAFQDFPIILASLGLSVAESDR